MSDFQPATFETVARAHSFEYVSFLAQARAVLFSFFLSFFLSFLPSFFLFFCFWWLKFGSPLPRVGPRRCFGFVFCVLVVQIQFAKREFWISFHARSGA